MAGASQSRSWVKKAIGAAIPVVIAVLWYQFPTTTESLLSLVTSGPTLSDRVTIVKSIVPLLQYLHPGFVGDKVLLNAVSASEAFESFLRDENSTLLLSNRYLLPEDYINADCECKSADCRQDVVLGIAETECNGVRPFKIGLSSARIALIIKDFSSDQARAVDLSMAELRALYTGEEVLACSKLGRDKARPVRLFLPSRDTATGYNFLESIFESDGDDQSCANSASPVQIGQHVVIYSNFADIMQRVSNDECAVGVVPHMIAKEKIKAKPGSITYALVEGQDVSHCSGSCEYKLMSPILLYMNLNRLDGEKKIDGLYENLLEKVVEFTSNLLDVPPPSKKSFLALKRMEMCSATRSVRLSSQVKSFFSQCPDFTCCYRDTACSPNYVQEKYVINLQQLFFDTPCSQCKDIATQYNFRNTATGCEIQSPGCIINPTIGINTICAVDGNEPLSVCFECTTRSGTLDCGELYIYKGVQYLCEGSDTIVYLDGTLDLLDVCQDKGYCQTTLVNIPRIAQDPQCTN